MPTPKANSKASTKAETPSSKHRRRLHRLRDESSSEDDAPDFSDGEKATLSPLSSSTKRDKDSTGKAKAGHAHRVRRQRDESSDEDEERALLEALSADLSPPPSSKQPRVEKLGSSSSGGGGAPSTPPSQAKKKKRVRRAREADSGDEDGGGAAGAGASINVEEKGDEQEEEWLGDEEEAGPSSQATTKGEAWREEVDGGGLRGSQATARGSPAAEDKGKRRKRLRRAEDKEEEEELRAKQTLAEVFGGGGRRESTSAPKVEREIMNEVKKWARGAREDVARVRGKHGRDEEEQGGGEEEDDEDGLADFIVEDEDDEEGGVGHDFYVKCVCGATSPGRDADERLWVECSNPECAVWVHGDCYGLMQAEDVPSRFKCHVCDPKGTSRLLQAEAMAAKAEKLVKKYPTLELYSMLDKGEGGEGGRDFKAAIRRLGGGAKALRLAGPYRKTGVTLLMRAAELGRADEVGVLLEAGAQPLERDLRGRRSAAMYALAAADDDESCIAVLQQLVDAEPGVLSELDGRGRNLLHYAGSRAVGSGAALAWLLAKLGEEEAGRLAGQRDQEEATPLLVACEEGCEEAVLGLLRVDAEAARTAALRGTNGLMLCISRGLSEAAVALARAGSHNLLLQRDDQEGATCLHYAAGKGDAASAEAILERVGPQLVDAGDDNQVSALHLAAAEGHTEVVTALLRHGARPDVRDEQGWTPLLYADFKAQEDTILSLLAVDPHSQLVVLGELLRSKRGSDERVARVLKGLIVVPSYLHFINDLVARDPHLLDTSLDFLLDQPDLLDLRNKTMYLERQLEDLRLSSPPWDPYGLGTSLYLKRDGTWPDLCRKLLRKEPSTQMLGSPEATLRGRVLFQLAGDPGIGPGVEREVLELLSRGLVEEGGGEAAAFRQAADQSSYVPLEGGGEVRRTLYAVGLLLGHVLLWRKVLSVNLNACFLKLVLGRAVGLDDMADLDAAVHRSLRYILENEGAGDLELSFTYGPDEVPLCKDGASKRVTDDNKAEYVQLVVKHLTHGLMGEQAACLREGIGAVLHDPRGRLLGLYTAQEFAVLVSGVGVIDPSSWEQHATYSGYRATSPQIPWFWRFVRGLSATERALLLKFCTGQSRLPVGGFESLSPKFQVLWVPFERSQPMPQAATCFHQLKLPAYPSFEDLERWVLLAIRFGSDGFAFT